MSPATDTTATFQKTIKRTILFVGVVFFVFIIGIEANAETLRNITGTHYIIGNANQNSYFVSPNHTVETIDTVTVKLYSLDSGTFDFRIFSDFGSTLLYASTTNTLPNSATDITFDVNVDVSEVESIYFRFNSVRNIYFHTVYNSHSIIINDLPSLFVRTGTSNSGYALAGTITGTLLSTSTPECPECPECPESEICGTYDLYEPVLIDNEPDISIMYDKTYIYNGTSTVVSEIRYNYRYIPFIQYLLYFSIFLTVIIVIFTFKRLNSNR